ncbi:CatB-related O-acetyltransferase [Terrisporobacter sp.]
MKKKIKFIIKCIYIMSINMFYKSKKIKSMIPFNLEIGEYVIIENGCIIEKGIKNIGDGTYIGNDVYINHCDSIGKYCSIARGVGIGIGNHPIDRTFTTPLFYKSDRGLVKATTYDYKEKDGSVIIGNDVWIGYNAIILNSVTIGDGAIIAAGAVVTKDVEPYSIVGGVPAKVLKYRFSEEIRNEMIDKNISNLPIDNIYKNIDEVDNVKNFIEKYNSNELEMNY